MLQQTLAVAVASLALGWAWICWGNGLGVWAFAAVALIAGAYAGALALEFAFLRVVDNADPAPRASALQLLRAWWCEVRMGLKVFFWRQPFRSMRWPDQLPAHAHGRRGVLFIHGFVCNRGLWNPWLRRLTAEGVPFVAVDLQPVFGAIDTDLAGIDDAVRRLAECTGLAPVIVAHSMGGLAARSWWASLPTAQNEVHETAHDGQPVHHVITIGAPHHGTWLARFGRSPSTRQMRQGSRWLQALQASEPATRYRHFTCFYSHCDNIVFPASTATLDGAENRHLPGLAHVQMADAPEPWDALQRLLQQKAAH